MIYFYLFKKMKIFIHDNTKIVQFVGIYNIIINYFTIPIISFRNENLQYIGTIKTIIYATNTLTFFINPVFYKNIPTHLL
jgi:hypothetical protein